MLALAAHGVTKIFTRGGTQVVAVRDATLAVDGGEVVALMGAEWLRKDDVAPSPVVDRSADRRRDRHRWRAGIQRWSGAR